MKNPKLKVQPIKVKAGVLSIADKQYITENWKKHSTADIATKLKRSEKQIDDYIKANLYDYETENQKTFATKHGLEKHKTVMQMTEVESSKATKKKDKRDRPWIFKQP